MKRFKLPIEKTETDYKLWGVTIPKIQNGSIQQLSNKIRKSSSTSMANGDAKNITLGNDAKKEDADAAVYQNGQPEQFTDIVFSFFPNEDQNEYIDIVNNTDTASNGNYESMSPVNGHKESEDDKGSNKETIEVHKSEMTFFVQPAMENYDLPPNKKATRVYRSSSYTVQNKCLNDISESDSDDNVKSKNSASLDNLSQLCNTSLKNSDSKKSISSLPESPESFNKKAKDFIHNQFQFPRISQAFSPRGSSARSDYSTYKVASYRAEKLKNRLSALYNTHKGFKGKKKLSKAWYGFKEWLETEKLKVDKVIQKHSPKKMSGKSSEDDYPDSEFSEYEDVGDASYSVNSFRDENMSTTGAGSTKFDSTRLTKYTRKDVRSLSISNSEMKLDSVVENGFLSVRGGSLRHSKSQPTVMEISEPTLVKINCENVDGDKDHEEDDDVFDGEDKDRMTAGSVSPDCMSTKSDQHDIQAQHQQQQPLDQSMEEDKYATLKSIVKEGSTMCKELLTIFQQRAEAERQYCCGVLRVGARARRASKGASGAALASRRAALDMETRAQLHRQFSNRLVDEVVRPLQRLISTRDAVRKQVDGDVQRAAKRLCELREVEARAKKASHEAARYNERLQDTSISRKNTPEQESELAKKKTKSEEAAIKSDVEYYMACIKAEKARVEWETSVVKGLESLVKLEEERLNSMRKALRKYVSLTTLLGPGAQMDEALSLEGGLEEALAGEVRVARSMLIQPAPAMHLPDFYCQHTTLAMNRERRVQALMKIIQLIKNDIDKERKSKQALEKLSKAIVTTPNFGANDSQQNLSEKLYHMRSLLTYLEGARVQASASLAATSGRAKAPHPLSQHLHVSRDRRGLQCTILQVPPWLQREYRSDNTPPNPPSPNQSPIDRGVADGVSIQHYSDIEDNLSESPPERPPLPAISNIDLQGSYKTLVSPI